VLVSPTARSRDAASISAAGPERGSGLVAIKDPRDGSAVLSSIVQSDAFVVLDEDAGDLAANSVVDFMPFSEALA
jgi:molybdopterin biosynthesis enzyme